MGYRCLKQGRPPRPHHYRLHASPSQHGPPLDRPPQGGSLDHRPAALRASPHLRGSLTFDHHRRLLPTGASAPRGPSLVLAGRRAAFPTAPSDGRGLHESLDDPANLVRAFTAAPPPPLLPADHRSGFLPQDGTDRRSLSESAAKLVLL